MLYLDTSALVKFYLDEAGRSAVTAAVSAEAIVATQELAYIEAHAAFRGRNARGASRTRSSTACATTSTATGPAIS
jgi:predicted nucleic acid-binding protein